jgi:Flp pilus assembly protein TadG
MENRTIQVKSTKEPGDESGAISIVMITMMIAFLGALALAFDFGHLVLVKSELQKAADAGALSGAVALTPTVGSSLTPLWSNGQTAAANTVNDLYNKADNQQSHIATTDVTAGYWLLIPQGQTQTFPQNKPAIGYMPVPAIRVTLNRTVNFLFAPLINANTQHTISASATAVIPISYATAPFAMAVEKGIVIYPDGHTINLSPQDFGWKDEGQWYNTDGSNNVPSIRKNVPLKIGSQIYIAPGAMTTLYGDITYPQTIIVPVVDSTDQKTWQTVIGYAAFEIMGVDSKSISGHFLNKFFSPDAIPDTGDGTYYGVSGTPKLVGP